MQRAPEMYTGHSFSEESKRHQHNLGSTFPSAPRCSCSWSLIDNAPMPLQVVEQVILKEVDVPVERIVENIVEVLVERVMEHVVEKVILPKQ